MAKQIFRLIVHIVVVGTLAVMVLSLRSQLNEAKRELARRAAAPQAPAQREGGVYVLTGTASNATAAGDTGPGMSSVTFSSKPAIIFHLVLCYSRLPPFDKTRT